MPVLHDSYSLAAIVAALALTLIDWRLDVQRRSALAEAVVAWSYRARDGPLGSIVARGAGVLRRRISGLFGTNPFAVRFIGLVMLAELLIATLALSVGALWLQPRSSNLFHGILRSFGPAAVPLPWLSLTAALILLRATEVRARLPGQALLALLQIAAALALWLGAMHLGAWLDWRKSASPLGFGTELFYAAAYLTYLREPGGRMVSVLVALAAGLPPTVAVLQFVWSAAGRPVFGLLARGAVPLLQAFQRVRRGRLAGSVIAAATLALVLRWGF